MDNFQRNLYNCLLAICNACERSIHNVDINNIDGLFEWSSEWGLYYANNKLLLPDNDNRDRHGWASNIHIICVVLL